MQGKILCLFKQLGTAIEVEEEHLPYFQTMTCMMGPFYQHCQFLQEWVSENINGPNAKQIASKSKVDEEDLRNYLVGFFDTLISDAHHGRESWQKLMNAQTKGGLNEQAMVLMRGTKQVTHSTMDSIVERIKGASKTE